MKRIITPLAACTAGALLLAACGGDATAQRPPAETMADYLNGEHRDPDDPITPAATERLAPDDCDDTDKNALTVTFSARADSETAAVAALYLWCGEDIARAAVDGSGVPVDVADLIDTVDRYAKG